MIERTASGFPPPAQLFHDRAGFTKWLHEVLEDASQWPSALVRVDGGETGSIVLRQGTIVWARAKALRGGLMRALSEVSGVQLQTLRGLVAKCRASGRSFSAVLRENGVSQESFESALRKHNRAHLEAIIDALEEDADASRLCADEIDFESQVQGMVVGELMNPLEGSPSNAASAPVDSAVVAAVNSAFSSKAIAACLDDVMQLDGAIAAALVDWKSEAVLGTRSEDKSFDILLAASGNTAVVRAKVHVMDTLGIEGGIEDILISLKDQFHLIRPLRNSPSLFLYLAISRDGGNLGFARLILKSAEQKLAEA